MAERAELISDPRPRMPINDVAAMWGCEPERIAWLVHNGHLEAFTIGAGRTTVSSFRVFPLEAERKQHLISMPIDPDALAIYAPPAPRPKKPKPEITPLLERMLEVLKQVAADANMYVYFVRCGEFVKIGQSQSPVERIASLRTSTPYDLKLLKVVRAGMGTERALHRALGDFHHKLEWFRLDNELATAIKALPGVRKSRYV